MPFWVFTNESSGVPECRTVELSSAPTNILECRFLGMQGNLTFYYKDTRVADKALLLGINNYKKVTPLRGCVNDVENMRKLLTEIYGFNPSNVKVLLNQKAVKKEVRTQMAWLFRDAKPNERVVFHFSGHGSQTVDLDGDESENADELICLYDMDFGDPESYLLDDELRDWTKKLPAGVRLTVVLDSCHSGSGTRMLMAPVAGKSSKLMPMVFDSQVTVARALSGNTQTRGLGANEAALIATDPNSEDLVRVRYIEPPQEIKDAIEARGTKSARGLVVANMNHVLLAGCKDSQTSADATIDRTPSGAFTYYLCKTIRDGGAKLERKELINRVEVALRDNHFSQVPQLEGPTDKGPLFSGSREPNVETSKPSFDLTDLGVSVGVDGLKNLIPTIAILAPEAQVEALRLFGTLAGFSERRVSHRAVGERFLIYVHGICQHEAGYSDGWWNALRPFTSAFGPGTLGGTRREVLWSDIVNERAFELKSNRAVGAGAARQLDEQEQLKESIIDSLRERTDRQIIAAGPTDLADGEAVRAFEDARAVSIPGLNCIDDFTVYMVNESVRAEVIERFTRVVRPLLESGAELDIVSHSWGTVVAYEGLRELAETGVTSGGIRNFFTVGAALSIGPVKMSLRSDNRDGKRPAMVHRWVNLNARGDVVGGTLKGRPYAVDSEFPGLDAFNCTKFFGIALNPTCAHSSYFVSGNNAVNRDIFAKCIDQV